MAKSKSTAKSKLDVKKHLLVPKHSKLSDKDKKRLLEKFHVTFNELPKISLKDPAIIDLKLKQGDLVRIERPSKTASRSIFYRTVI